MDTRSVLQCTAMHQLGQAREHNPDVSQTAHCHFNPGEPHSICISCSCMCQNLHASEQMSRWMRTHDRHARDSAVTCQRNASPMQ
eukprot:scaffold287321_cov24-Tisochrysis_lutea.AAC.1